MIIAPIPVDEHERLAALRSYFLLDSEPEAEFDGIVKLASYICQTPIAAISLVDTNRQWFKAITGLDAKETSRDVAFCAHTILQNEALVVPNALNDERFCDNPLVSSSPEIRFYAGISLISPEGQHLGTLCVIDRVPRELSSEQLDSLKILAVNIMAHFNLRRASEDRIQLIMDTSMDAIISLDRNGLVTGWNNRAEIMFGYSQADALGKDLIDLIAPPHKLDLYNREIRNALKIDEGQMLGKRIEIEAMRFDLSEFRAEFSITVIHGEKDIFFSAFVRDISELKKNEQALRIAATAFESQEGMIITDAKGNILRVNNAFSSITGYAADEVIGRNPRLLNSGQHDKTFYLDMWETISSNGSWDGEIWNRRKNGQLYPEHLTITAVRDKDGQLTNYVGTLTDITQSKYAAEEIERLAFYDPLTHLPNRRLLLDRLTQALASSTRSGKLGAVLFLDLDHFKTLNDSLGHDIGDVLLQQVSQRLETCIREGDTIARLGGDEFVVLLEDLCEQSLEAATQAQAIAEKILANLNQPYALFSHTYHSTASIGITLFRNHEEKIDVLLKQADIAMYQAKQFGRNTLRFFNPKMQECINSRVELEFELHKALEKRQFKLHYQIQSNNFGRALGAEVLLRWLHPIRGIVSPADFIPLAEETGLILPIGKWVLETACAQLEAWNNNKLTRELSLSVNVSAKQFHQTDFVAQVEDTVRGYEFNPCKLKLELTESMLSENIDYIINSMSRLRQIGIQFSLDDFGTGYSSLQYLKKLPINQLKIDQSFVHDITFDEQDRSIVRTIIAMAHSMDLEVIAEGVETEDQKQRLLHKGCNQFQGYLFGRPVPLNEFEARLRRAE